MTMTHQLNTQDLHIQFSIEEPNQERALPILDTLVSPGPNSTLVTTVYRKPTHTNQYLHLDSNHFITAKSSVFNTLAFRAKVVCSSQQALHKEMEHTMGSQHSTVKTTPTMDKQPQTTNPTKQWIKQQKHLHSGTVHPQSWGKAQKDM